MVRLVHLVLQGDDGVGSAIGLAHGDGHLQGGKGGVIGARHGHGGARRAVCAVLALDGEGHVLGSRLTQGHRDTPGVALGSVFPFSGYGDDRPVKDVRRGRWNRVRHVGRVAVRAKDLSALMD